MIEISYKSYQATGGLSFCATFGRCETCFFLSTNFEPETLNLSKLLKSKNKQNATKSPSHQIAQKLKFR